MSGEEYVVCGIDNGYLVENGAPASITTHFNLNSVGIVHETRNEQSVAYIIGENANYLIAGRHLTPLNPLETDKGYAQKICNICHCLKDHNEFSRNQTDAGGKTTTRPSCKICRRNIDQNPMTKADKARAEKTRPAPGSLFRCPICRKRSIVGVTAKIVLDHRHGDGASREFLCDSCNTGLGRFKNGHNYLKNAITYLAAFEK